MRKGLLMVFVLPALLLLTAMPLRAQTSGDTDVASDAEVLAGIDSMEFETAKHLLYLYARLNKPKVAEALASKVLTQSPGDRETLLVMGSMYLERKNAVKTLQMGQLVLKYYPDDNQGWYFIASAYSIMNRMQESEAIFRRLKDHQFKQGPFPYDIDLGSAARLTGHWREAMHAYKRILSANNISPQLRQEARRVLDEIYRENLPQMTVSSDWVSLETGDIWRQEFEFAFPADERNRIFVSVIRDEISIEETEFLKPGWGDRIQGLVTDETFWPSDWRTRVGLGSNGNEPVALIRARHEFEPECAFSFGPEYNFRAQDSLLLEQMDGRQDRMVTELGWLLLPDTKLNWEGFIRRVRIGDEEIGQGYGFTGLVEQRLLRKPFELTIAYQGQFESFDSRDTHSILDNPGAKPLPAQFDPVTGALVTPQTPQRTDLVSREINRHDLILILRGKFIKQWGYEVGVQGGYLFVEESEGYGAYGEFQWFFTKSIEMRWRAGYQSSGEASNSSSEVLHTL